MTVQPGEHVDIVRTTCPRDCYDACGIRVIRRDGAIVRVAGDPDHRVNRGSLCGKCTLAYNGAWRDPAVRLTRPLRRVGPKGEGRFTAISWEEALGTIAERLAAILSSSGGASVLHTHYTGTCSLIAYNFPLRFFNRLGATEVDPDTVCNKAGHVALQMTFGSSLDGFDPRTARDAACIVVWGANPSATAPHAHLHWLREAPGKVIVVDPIRHPTAAAADLHLQPFPGSDAALAFALLHVCGREGLLDQRFLAERAIGWDEVRPLLAACTPEWAEGVTGVPARDIDAAARLYGRGPSLLWLGQGLQRQPMGGNVMRACSLLPVATGNLGKPGAGFLYLNGPASRGINLDYLTAPTLNPGPPRSISHMDLAARLEDRANTHALFCWNNNIVASSPQQARLRQALRRDDLFTVALDLFATDTVDHADVVLPAASFLEFDDLVCSYFDYSLSAQVKAAEPMCEALPNQEIVRRLAAAMGFREPELFEDDKALLANLLQQTGLPLDFAALARVGTVAWPTEPVIQFRDLRFATPSGKIELASERFSAVGLPRAPQPLADARPAGQRLRLLSPAATWLMNSTFANEGKIDARLGPAEVWLHPEDAAARGFETNRLVTLTNACGRLTLRVALTDTIPRGVAVVHKGRWPKLDATHANVNLLNAGQKTDLAESSAVHAIEVDLLPAALNECATRVS
jgi:anaerobic selenocysteine-containing dehydrogenase